jgi:uridine kinase
MAALVTSAEVVAAAAGLARRRPGQTLFVGIDGFGAAGKSTLAAAIVTAIPQAVVVPIDDFWGPSIPEWDWARFRAQVLAPLLADRPARYQVWDWDCDTGGEWVEFAPGRMVVIEGVSATRDEAGVPWDLTVWVEAPRELRLARALERDGRAMLGRWLDDWMPSEQAYAARQRPLDRVDLLVHGIE